MVGLAHSGPIDASLATGETNDTAMQVTYSHKVENWVIADHMGHIMAQGEPGELAEWMQEYLTGMQAWLEEIRLQDKLAQSDRLMGRH